MGMTAKTSHMAGIRRAYHRGLWMEKASGKARLATPGYCETINEMSKGREEVVSRLRAVHGAKANYFLSVPTGVKR